LSIKSPADYPCIFAHTSLRYYEYDFTYGDVPAEVETFFHDVLAFITTTYETEDNYDFDSEIHDGFRVGVTYPMTTDDHHAEVEIRFPESSYYINDFYYSNLVRPLKIESTHFTRNFQLSRYFNLLSTCLVKTEDTEFIHELYHEVHLKEQHKFYPLLVDKENTTTWGVYASKDEEHLAVKFMFNNSTVVITTEEDREGEHKFLYMMDNQMYNFINHFESFDEIYNFKLFQVKESVVLVAPELELFVVYDGHHIKVEYYPREHIYEGVCIE